MCLSLREVIFSHGLRAKVKKILPKVLPLPELRRGQDRLRWGAQAASNSPQDGFGRGEACPFRQALREKLLKGSKPKCPCKAIGLVLASCRLPGRGFQSAFLVGGLAALRQGYGGPGDRRSLRRRFAPSLTFRQSLTATGAAAELAEFLVAGWTLV